MKNIHLFLTLFTFLFTTGLSAASGVVLNMETVEADSGETLRVEIKAIDNRLWMDNEGDIVIFDASRNELTIISAEERAYYVIGQAQLEQMKGALAAMQRQMEEALAQVPAAQREQVRQMMAGHMPDAGSIKMPKVTVEETGKTKKVNDYALTQALVKADGELTAELWFVPWNKIDGGEMLMKNIQGMAAFMVRLMESVPQFGDGMEAAEASWMQAMQDFKGFPIESTSFERGQKVETTTVQSVQSRSLSESDFQPPAGYRRQELELPGM